MTDDTRPTRALARDPTGRKGAHLRTIGGHARSHQLLPEQLLVLIKDVCGAIHEGASCWSGQKGL